MRELANHLIANKNELKAILNVSELGPLKFSKNWNNDSEDDEVSDIKAQAENTIAKVQSVPSGTGT